MATFPTLTPSTRTFTPGLYPHTVFAGMSGKSNRVRNSNAMLQSQLRLSFMAITEAEMLSILAHYNGQQGSFLSFPLPSAVWSGGTASDFELSGYGWIYREPPTVEDLMCGGHNVQLVLETVPPEGTALVGLNLTMRYLLAAGTATTAPGAALSMTYALTAGLVGAPGINGTIGYSLTPGSVDSGATDPDFANVSALLHFDGSITDDSSNGFTVSVFGDAQVTATDPKFGSGALLLDGTGDYLTLPADAAFEFGSGDFTVECWVYVNTGNTNDGLFTFGGSSSGLAVAIVSGQWRVTTTGGDGTSMGSVTTEEWQHLSVCRSGSSLRMFINGTQLGSTLSNSTNLTDNQLKIGYYYSTLYAINAKVDEFRVTKGVARYTANFTAPTAAFPDS
jgi:hypothetical protein